MKLKPCAVTFHFQAKQVDHLVDVWVNEVDHLVDVWVNEVHHVDEWVN